MNYQEALQFLYEQLPMYSRVGAAAYRKDLVNIKKLCTYLGDPQVGMKFIHVAGTNGKGSVSHMLSSVLQEAGYLTGLNTSPHLKSFTERIRVNGREIEEDFVTDFTQKMQGAIKDIQPSFFELTFAMALQYFAEKRVHIAVIETGMGGRLDSTNIIQPELSVITQIGLDHTDFLGKDLATIAGEKSGIIKKNTPVVVGEILPETFPVFVKKANEMDAPLLLAGERFTIEYLSLEGGFLQCHIKAGQTGIVEKLQLDTTGLYQGKNACTVLAAIYTLKKAGWNIPREAIHRGFQHTIRNTQLKARWQIIKQNPMVILDVAHNADGFRDVVQQLHHQYPNRQYHFVIGMVSDKSHERALSLLPANAKYYFTRAGTPRALPEDELRNAAAQFNLNGNAYPNINLALLDAKRAADPQDIILCIGSFFTLAELEEAS